MLSTRRSLPELISSFCASEETITTPTLDFHSHSAQLIALVDQLVDLRDTYPVKASAFGLPLAEKNTVLLKCCFQALVQLNKLTRPPAKRTRAPAKPHTILYTEHIIEEIDIDKVSVHSFDPTLSQNQKATYLYIRGRLLNVFDGYHQGAENNLAKSVKFNPSFIGAWNELGECYYKKGDLESSRKCFQWANSVVKNY